jgi:hypothetical protein
VPQPIERQCNLARNLAHLLRLHLLPESYSCPREPRALHDLLHRRLLLVYESVSLTSTP